MLRRGAALPLLFWPCSPQPVQPSEKPHQGEEQPAREGEPSRGSAGLSKKLVFEQGCPLLLLLSSGWAKRVVFPSVPLCCHPHPPLVQCLICLLRVSCCFSSLIMPAFALGIGLPWPPPPVLAKARIGFLLSFIWDCRRCHVGNCCCGWGCLGLRVLASITEVPWDGNGRYFNSILPPPVAFTLEDASCATEGERNVNFEFSLVHAHGNVLIRSFHLCRYNVTPLF